MPEVYLDGARIDYVDTRNDATIGELVSAIEEEMRDLRRFVLELWIDGQKLDDSVKGELLKQPINSFTDVEFKTVSIESLALEGVDMVQEYINVIKDNIDDCAEGIRVGGPNTDVLLASILEGIVEIVKTTDALIKGVENYKIDLFRENPTNYYKPLMNFLEDLVEALNGSDSVLLADTLEYELKPFLAHMEEALFFRADA